MEMRVERFGRNRIRFVEYQGEWWAVLKDVCDAVRLRTDKVSERLSPDNMEKISINISDNPLRVNRSRGENKTRQMLIVNECGIYEALFASRKLEARKFRNWSASVIKKLRNAIGLQGYQAFMMTNPDVQEHIDWFLDSLYYDPEKKMIMQSVTVQGGDVEQIPFAKA